MKNDFLKILADEANLKAKKLYNQLLEAYSKVATVRQVYHYQLGYSPAKLENLKYEIKKVFDISDKEVALYVPGEDEDPQSHEPVLQINGGSKTIENVGGRTADDIAKQLAEQNPVLADLYNNPDAQEGLKLRDEYPFLNDPNCPNEFKILVADKISAYKNYAAKHAETLEAADAGEAEDKLFELAKETLGNYEMNQEAKEELDFFRDTNGKILGKHPLLADLKLNQDVNEMTEADLVKARNNGLKSVNKYKDAEGKEHLYDLHSKKLDLVTGRLQKDFKMEFDKK
ncbi:hypothetical protein L0B70_00495 [Kaistella sp. 97-N-M2]|uniref:hypothetical protein n=1 Tax=Kaistella sp. 97-N-M2 TaxID=2908645 RepID=UPI001F3C67B1|nr:hypothetical protein [Kaistella sp. 97-N-M2]UJF29907.1 hypothetical protein L0B70_00495 [Kaistella sp. 97-N-M2]